MDWRQELIDYATRLGRNVYESEFGIGIEFEDGADAFWVLPGEPMSTVAISLNETPAVNALIAEYERLNRLRKLSLHVVRHHCAQQNLKLSLHRSGDLSYEGEGFSGGLSAGESLTVAARDSQNVEETFDQWQEPYWIIGERLTPERIRKYLAIEDLPEETAVTPDEELEPPQTIADALAMFGFCRALSKAQNSKSLEQLRSAAEPRGRIVRVLKQLSERLPDVSAGLDIQEPGTFELDFSDGLDTFPVETVSPEMTRRLRNRTPAEAAADLAREYRSLDNARSRLLNAVWYAAKKRGWGAEQLGANLLERNPQIHLGSHTREISLEAGTPLTERLRSSSPADVLRELFGDAPDFLADCLAALDRDGWPNIELPHVTLRPKDLPPAVELRELTPSLVAEMDAFADAALQKVFRNRETLGKYRDSEFQNPETDHWMDREAWVRLAERHVSGKWPDPAAVVILFDAGDPQAEAAARKWIEAVEPHYEMPDEVCEIVWRFRHEYPKKARHWFAPGVLEGEFDEVRARLGDPVAARRKSLPSDWILREEDFEDENAVDKVRFIPPDQQEAVHRALIEWARTEHRWSPLPDIERLRVAAAMEWRDVADSMTENPYLPSGLLRADQRPEQFDEPGMLFAYDLLLVWSGFAPSEFLARLVATAIKTDLLELANQAALRDAEKNPEVEQILGMTIQAYEGMVRDIQPALAIAWKRCRNLI